MDTVSRMVRRVHDEVEHGRDVARLEQLEELEEHVYLCLLTINPDRRLFAEEMGEDRTSSV
ncbi:hypothetical protein HPP92_008344 [Vanilla planifolia]|uniref:Uncharacterized protein n=1 Tax=Vanilla planifolia TaxID=51239 RepID=A0A835R2H4_VANPL|nr:hypothetical protein HPP92_008344 [Vanilla planifolia]